MAMDDPLERMVEKVSLDPEARITISDVKAWAGSTTNWEFYNAIALRIAEEYHSGALSYSVCDNIMNGLWGAVLDGLVSSEHKKVPDLFYDVYLAFDAGEYFRTADKSDDPVADHTDPQIAEILHEHVSASTIKR